mgnify:CR=1 FL=1
MDRREVLRNISLMTGAAFVGAEIFLQTGCKPKTQGTVSLVFSDSDLALLDEIGETIIPTTDTPGAKATQIGSFMKLMVEDCYSDTERNSFLKGIAELSSSFTTLHKVSFEVAEADLKKTFLQDLDAQAKTYNTQKSAEQPPHYFTMLKQLTILGYFTSEIGATQTLRYVAVPGRYDGAVPYKKGDKAWAV